MVYVEEVRGILAGANPVTGSTNQVNKRRDGGSMSELEAAARRALRWLEDFHCDNQREVIEDLRHALEPHSDVEDAIPSSEARGET